MTVTAPEAPQARPRRRNAVLRRGDCLKPFSEAAESLGCSTDTLRRYHDAGHFPAVVTPGGQWLAYQSFIDAVLASARPGRAGDFAAIAADWFAAHTPDAVAS